MADEKPKFRLIDCLKQSLEIVRPVPPEIAPPVEEAGAEIVELDLERIERSGLTAKDVTPEDILRLCLKDVKAKGNVVKCYVTLISELEDSFTVSNYRSNLTRTEEVAFRQLGVTEAVDSWRFGPDAS